MQVLGSMVMALLVKYWIYICGGMFFFVSFEGTIVMYKIIYMMMFLSCVALYQVSETTTADTVGLPCAEAELPLGVLPQPLESR